MTRRASIAVASVAGGLILAWLIAPLVFLHLPNDRARIGEVVRLLRTHPRLAVIGNSVAMYGVRVGTNLATPGQLLSESAMIAGELRDTKTIVLVVTPWQLAARSSLNAQGWNAWWMYGLRPSEESRALSGMPAMSDWRERIRSRWIVRAAFESLFARGHAAAREVWMSREAFAVDPHQRALLEAIAKRRHVVVVLAPLSPIVRAHYPDISLHLENAQVLDATHLLDAGGFRDDTHPNDAGAAKLTQFIEEHL